MATESLMNLLLAKGARTRSVFTAGAIRSMSSVLFIAAAGGTANPAHAQFWSRYQMQSTPAAPVEANSEGKPLGRSGEVLAACDVASQAAAQSEAEDRTRLRGLHDTEPLYRPGQGGNAGGPCSDRIGSAATSDPTVSRIQSSLSVTNPVTESATKSATDATTDAATEAATDAATKSATEAAGQAVDRPVAAVTTQGSSTSGLTGEDAAAVEPALPQPVPPAPARNLPPSSQSADQGRSGPVNPTLPWASLFR